MRNFSKQVIRNIALGTAAGIGIVCIALTLPTRTPVYQGQSIDKWFAALTSKSQTERKEAASAFAAIGKGSLSYLLSQAEAGKPTTRERLQSWVNASVLRRPQSMGCGLSLESEADSRQARLVRAFETLGEQASPAILKLGNLLSDPQCAYGAAASLVAIGPSSSQQLEQAIRDDNVDVRRIVASSLGDAKTARTNSVSLLLRAMNDPDALVRHYAAHSVGQLTLRPKESVLALTAALEDSDTRVRYIAIHALSKFGPDALPALPMLSKLEGDHEESVRKSAVEVAQGLRGFSP